MIQLVLTESKMNHKTLWDYLHVLKCNSNYRDKKLSKIFKANFPKHFKRKQQNFYKLTKFWSGSINLTKSQSKSTRWITFVVKNRIKHPLPTAPYNPPKNNKLSRNFYFCNVFFLRSCLPYFAFPTKNKLRNSHS